MAKQPRQDRLRDILRESRWQDTQSHIKQEPGHYLKGELPFVRQETTRFFNSFKPRKYKRGYQADLFLGKLESALVLRLRKIDNGRIKNVGHLGIAFNRVGGETEVIINVLQGRRNNIGRMQEIQEVFRKSWQHFLVQLVIDQAYRQGYSKVKLVRAEKQFWIKHKLGILKKSPKQITQLRRKLRKLEKEGKRGQKKIREQIEKFEEEVDEAKQVVESSRWLYDKTANELGLKTKEGDYWVLRFPRAK
tara:strand:+ start:2677 stop:3420 length:744 start_codon:yes stop_codon:yes gene_type:complete